MAGVLFAAAVLLLNVRQASGVDVDHVRGYVTLALRPHSPLGKMALSGDGQAYLALARDPTLSRPAVFTDGPGAAAYRAQRPLLGWLAWAGSAGRSGAALPAIAVILVLSFGLAAAAGAVLFRARGAAPALALILLAFPGSLLSLQWLTPELLALGFAFLGVHQWIRERPRPWAAGCLLAVAALGRETMLLVVAALAVHVLVAGRRRIRDLLPLAVAPAVWAAWQVVVRVRFGRWFFQGGGQNLAAPGVGIVRGLRLWGDHALVGNGAVGTDVVCLIVLVGVVVAALGRRRGGPVAWIVTALAAFSLVMGAAPWATWQGFARALLPLLGFGLVLLFEDPDKAVNR